MCPCMQNNIRNDGISLSCTFFSGKVDHSYFTKYDRIGFLKRTKKVFFLRCHLVNYSKGAELKIDGKVISNSLESCSSLKMEEKHQLFWSGILLDVDIPL